MNILEFEVHNQILTRIDSQDVLNKSRNIYKCLFTFEEDSEWINLNKFVIFKDGWGNSSTVHLGKSSNTLSCLVPDEILRGSYFQVSIYAGDLITTNNVSVALIHSGYKSKKRSYCHHEGKDIFVEIFDKLDNTVDSIVYGNQTLHLFNRDSLLESIYLPFVLEEDLEELVNELFNKFINNHIALATDESDGLLSSDDKIKLDSIDYGANRTIVDNELDENSGNPISNDCVTKALNGKEDSYDIVEKMDDLIVDLIENGE